MTLNSEALSVSKSPHRCIAFQAYILFFGKLMLRNRATETEFSRKNSVSLEPVLKSKLISESFHFMRVNTLKITVAEEFRP